MQAKEIFINTVQNIMHNIFQPFMMTQPCTINLARHLLKSQTVAKYQLHQSRHVFKLLTESRFISVVLWLNPSNNHAFYSVPKSFVPGLVYYSFPYRSHIGDCCHDDATLNCLLIGFHAEIRQCVLGQLHRYERYFTNTM